MELESIKVIVIQTLYEVLQCMDGVDQNLTIELNEKTNPILHLGMKSVDEVLYVTLISIKLNCEIPDSVHPFVDEITKKPRTLEDITGFLQKYIKEGGKNE